MGNKRPLRPLRLKKEFSDLRDKGRYLKIVPWLVIQYKSNTSDEIRPAWTLSRKTAKAVSRNKMKRWSREYFRSLDVPPSIDLNLIFRSPEKGFFKTLAHEEFKRTLHLSMEKIVSRIK